MSIPSHSQLSPVELPTVAEIVQLHTDFVALWHRTPITNPCSGFLKRVCQQHEQNFRLWHEEDKARDPTADDAQIASVKRAIDRFNQARNDLIEQLDDAIAVHLERCHVAPAPHALTNSETPGSIIDRLSILALRIYHYDEQIRRDDVDMAHRQRVDARLRICREQQVDLAKALERLLQDLVAGRLRHKTYRQLKMYNDPSLNPAIYQRLRDGQAHQAP